MTSGEGGESSLHDKLQEQVSSSIREALDKSTSILSNLHRLSSYLDVMGSMLSSHDRLKNALDQVQNVRSDCASLLQTIYLGEIGLQSLQDVGKATSMSGIIPIFSDNLATTVTTNNSSIVAVSSNEPALFNDSGGASEEFSLGKRQSDENNDEPPSKKSAVAVFTCQGCQRTFGTNSEPGQIPSHCRKCRTSGAQSTTIHVSANNESPSSPVLSSTPLMTNVTNKRSKQRNSKRGKLNPMICRLCGISFYYRRCMLRHLRESHAPVVDVENLDQYMEIVTVQPDPLSPSQQDAALDIGIGSTFDETSDFNLNPSSSSVETAVLVSDEHDNNIAETNSMTSVTTAASFIEAAAHSLQAVEQVLLSSQESVESTPNNNTTELSELTPSSTEIDVAGVKIATTLRTSDTGSTFREYKCTICNKAFDRPYRLTRHLEIHDPNRPRIPCNYCTKTFTRKDSLESHIKTVHASVHPYTCAHDTCNRTFATRSMYLNHQKVHGESKPYHCQECNESFSLLNGLKDHLKTTHPENEDFRCVECFKVCISTDDLDHHKMYDHRFECEICGKIFARLAYLQVHVKVHNGESKFNCRYCSEGFGSLYAYRQHMKTHPEYRRTINVFPCHACNKVFQDPDGLVAHYQTEEHKDKASTLGASSIGTSTALSMMEGDLSVMSDLVTHVVMNESDNIINTIQGTYEGVTSSTAAETYDSHTTSQPTMH